MSKDEEYLDNLLKSMEETSVSKEEDSPSLFQEEVLPEEKTVFKDIEPEKEPEPEETALPEETAEPEETTLPEENALPEEPEVQKEETSEETDLSEEEEWRKSLDELLAGAEANSAEKEPETDGTEELDVTDLIDQMGGADDDLNEIGELLKKSDNNEAIDTASDEDMLELLNSVKEEPDALEEGKEKDKKKKSGLFSFGKKKKAKEDSENSEKIEEVEESENQPEESENQLEESENQTESAEEKREEPVKKEKKKGFWKRLIEELTREEEVPEIKEPVDENEEILKELEAEDQIKEKEKNKKGKKEKKKKGKKNKGAVTVEGNEDTATEEEGKKKKKPKREKKEKAEKPKEKSRKILSKKMLFALISFCATIIAAVVLLSIFLPDYADKKNARTSFYTGDYSKVYELLYDKNLNQSDQLIFERANVILKLQRRLDSYELNKKIGQEAEALDALLQGTLKYDEILSNATYGAEEELQVLYYMILDHLNQDYGISEEEAREINSYDSENYSRKIYSVVNGEDFSNPEQEADEEGKTQDNHKLQDILPEEEDLIQAGS